MTSNARMGPPWDRSTGDAIFYLQTRGIDKAAARQMLIYALANEVLAGIRIDPVREHLEEDLFRWLSENKKIDKDN